MNVFAPKSESRVTRRQAFKIGGLTVSFAALVAACGDDIQGDSSPGRVGYVPPITDPPEYVVDDAVLLRTASSLEYSAISVYEQALEIGGLDGSGQTLVETLIANHQAVADEMGALTEAEGGVAWECTNPWLVDRLLVPVLDLIKTSDDPTRDVLNLAVALENLAASTHQVLAVELSSPASKTATLEAATLVVAAVGGDRRAQLGAPTATSARRSSATVSRPTRRVFPTPTQSPAGSVPSARPNWSLVHPTRTVPANRSPCRRRRRTGTSTTSSNRPADRHALRARVVHSPSQW